MHRGSAIHYVRTSFQFVFTVPDVTKKLNNQKFNSIIKQTAVKIISRKVFLHLIIIIKIRYKENIWSKLRKRK